ncbi:Hypothetical protein CINCED_3A023928 [Cinara cedri]|uniref:Uncharacterized protein n=1 Tax=Cinara cedri TaxID=506608 RepID=A0A5E4NR01_9HEMI|nr:Hypothetical protein CINCED_3A023928 [Cinara cedri]
MSLQSANRVKSPDSMKCVEAESTATHSMALPWSDFAARASDLFNLFRQSDSRMVLMTSRRYFRRRIAPPWVMAVLSPSTVQETPSRFDALRALDQTLATPPYPRDSRNTPSSLPDRYRPTSATSAFFRRRIPVVSCAWAVASDTRRSSGDVNSLKPLSTAAMSLSFANSSMPHPPHAVEP